MCKRKLQMVGTGTSTSNGLKISSFGQPNEVQELGRLQIGKLYLKKRRLKWEEDQEEKWATGKSKLSPGQVINLSTAGRDELMRLPGIGETLANRIIENRPFKTIDSLLEVNGIGPKTLETIRSYLKL